MSNTVSTFYSELKENYLYAPGIATYGIDGKTGPAGKDGSSVYYSNIAFTNQNFSLIVSKIIKNEMLIYNSTEINSRGYQKNDIFITPSGEFWRLNRSRIELVDILEYNNNINLVFSNVGKINLQDFNKLTSLENAPFGIYSTGSTGDTESANSNSGIKVYTKKYNGIDFVSNNLIELYTGSGSYSDSNFKLAQDSILQKYTVNIISNINNNYIDPLLNITSVDQNTFNINNLNITYNSLDSGFHISSSAPIFLDVKDLRVKLREAEEQSYDQYSQLNVYTNSITEVYKYFSNSVRWDISTADPSESDETLDPSLNKLIIEFTENSPSLNLYNETFVIKLIVNDNNTIIEKIINVPENMRGGVFNGPCVISVLPKTYYTREDILAVSIITSIEVFILCKYNTNSKHNPVYNIPTTSGQKYDRSGIVPTVDVDVAQQASVITEFGTVERSGNQLSIN